MKLSDCKEALKDIIKFNLKQTTRVNHLIPMLWSSPGLGKTEGVKQAIQEVSNDLNEQLEFDTFVVAQHDPLDLGGIPVVDKENKTFTRAKGSFWDYSDDYKGVIMLDELPQSTPMIMNLMSQAILEGTFGEHKLPQGLTFICMGNPITSAAATNPMPSHLRNRLTHFDIDVDIETWVKWATENGLSHLITGFIRHRPEFLSKFKKDANAFPSPRAWNKVNSIIEAIKDHGLRTHAIKGTVGEGACADFMGHLRVADQMPDPELILKDPLNMEIPTEPPVLYAVCSALAAYAKSTNVKNLLTYINRIDNREFGAFTVRDMVNRTPDLKKNKFVTDWAMSSGRELIL